MDAAFLSQIAGVLLSLAFSYVPGLREWYDGFDSPRKALFMAGLLFLAASVIFAAACGGIYATGISCTQDGALSLIKVFIAALIANQGAYALFSKPFKG